jgi:hypothetical protein
MQLLGLNQFILFCKMIRGWCVPMYIAYAATGLGAVIIVPPTTPTKSGDTLGFAVAFVQRETPKVFETFGVLFNGAVTSVQRETLSTSSGLDSVGVWSGLVS